MSEAAPLVGVPEGPVPPGGAAEWIAGADGLKLRAALFPAPSPPRGSVIVSGGRAEIIEKYFEVVEELHARGFTVLAHDWRGQGLSGRLLSDRRRGHAERHQDFLADQAGLLAAFQSRAPKPWIALSHSMGGCLTLLALAQGERRFAGAALSAPMLGVSTAPVPAFLARVFARTITLLGGGGGYTPARSVSPDALPFERNILTHDRRRYEREQAQFRACPDLALGAPTWGWLDFAFTAMDELSGGAGVGGIDIPVVMVAAGDDRLVDNAAAKRIAGRLAKGQFVEVPGAFHELLQETDAVRAVFWREFDALAGQVAPI